jgi:hypothetical protein
MNEFLVENKNTIRMIVKFLVECIIIYSVKELVHRRKSINENV